MAYSFFPPNVISGNSFFYKRVPPKVYIHSLRGNYLARENDVCEKEMCTIYGTSGALKID